jgi:hypothetical protein
VLAATAVLPAGLAGCGGSSDDEQSAKQVLELQQAREQGRKEAQEEARAKKLARDAAALRKEVADLRKGKTTKSASTNAGAATSAASGGTSVKSCASGVTANSVTSCPFAESVRDEYYDNGGASSVSAYSPTTGQAYAMTCTGSGPVTCRGGNNAQVTFP